LSPLDSLSLDLQISCFSVRLDVAVIFQLRFQDWNRAAKTQRWRKLQRLCATSSASRNGGESEFILEAGAKIMFAQEDYGLAQMGYKHEFFRGLVV
jgi:hypothetical protein